MNNYLQKKFHRDVIALCAAAVLAVGIEKARGQATDAISREISVFNDLVNPVFALDTVSREISLFNDLVNPVTQTDVISREVTVLKYQQAVSSSRPGQALPVETIMPGAVLPDQLSLLNMPPPPYNPATWQPVQRKNTNASTPFRCDQVPDPLLQDYVKSSAYLLSLDEVTFDNCGSAWYRFAFNLPIGATNVTLYCQANVDDQGVAWLNGNQASGTMTVPPCVPTSQNHPCYTQQDTGQDRNDSMGRPILTSPTPDIFTITNQVFFLSGLNELVFAVSGDAAWFEPTGVEFQAFIQYDYSGVPFVADCDADCDGRINGADIQRVVDAILGAIANGCSPPGGDANGDGLITPDDIPQFVDCLLGP